MGKKLGQHFLENKEKILEIIAALEIGTNEKIIEIGPGHGELTRELIKYTGIKILAIEKDTKLVSGIRFLASNSKNIEIIEGDALKILPFIITRYERQNTKYKLVGNIPYYITGHLLRTVSEFRKKPELTVLTIQEEVALRLCAAPPHMNLLAASVQLWAEPKIVDLIPKKDFSPQPEVDSAIIKLKTRPAQGKIDKNYYRLIKTVFKQPRKTVFNNLRAVNLMPDTEILTLLHKSNINELERPHNLSLETLKKLALMLYNE